MVFMSIILITSVHVYSKLFIHASVPNMASVSKHDPTKPYAQQAQFVDRGFCLDNDRRK